MKKNRLFAGMVSAVLLTVAVPASHAAPIALSDDALEAISGKAGSFVTSDSLDISVALDGDHHSSNIQWGMYQWFDDHTSDQSQAKGGNQFDGAQSNVQGQVSTMNNALFWGSLGQSNLNASSIGNGGSNKAYATMSVGGF